MQYISVINEKNIEDVNELRLKGYQQAKGFHVAPAGVLWNRSDDESIVFGAWQENKLLATMRMEIITDRALLEQKIECPWDFPLDITFPVMVVSKSSTDPSCRKQGFNLAMTYYAMKFAKAWGAKFVVRTFVAVTSRINSMKAMGYHFFENDQGWTHSDYRSEAPVVVAALDLNKQYEQAMDVSRELVSSTLEAYPWSGDAPTYKEVNVVK